MIRKINLYLILLFVPLFGEAQHKHTLLHLDNDFYVTGEKVWYKLYLPHAPLGKEVAIKASLSTQSGKIIHSYFCNTAGSQFIFGKFELPYDLNTGWYQLVFSNFDPKTRLENLLSGVYIPVYNDLHPFPTLNSNTGFYKVENLAPDSKLNIFIIQDQIKPRQEVTVELSLTDSMNIPITGNASITVLDENLNKVNETINTFYKGVSDRRVEYSHVFNFDFETISTDQRNREYIGVYFNESSKFRYLSSINNKFTLVHDPFEGVKESQEIYIADFNKAISKSSLSLDPITTPIPFNQKIKEYLEWSSMRKRTLSIFPASSTAETKYNTKPASKDIPTPDRSIEISKYDEFEDIFSFFKELSTPLKFKLDRDKKTFATIYNAELSINLEGKPIFIIDGIITDRADWISKLPMATIKKVDIFYNTKTLLNYFGMIGKSGIVIIQTKTKINFPASIPYFKHDLNGFVGQPSQFEINKDQIASSKIPIFRPLVYWNANIQFDKQGKASLKFFHSDDAGEFLIKVVAIDQKGTISSAFSKYKAILKS